MEPAAAAAAEAYPPPLRTSDTCTDDDDVDVIVSGSAFSVGDNHALHALTLILLLHGTSPFLVAALRQRSVKKHNAQRARALADLRVLRWLARVR
ncbi:hypothetical protein ACFX15_012785 [Malus domestica]